MSENKDVKQINLEIQLDENTAQGQYVNMVVVSHSSSEFVMDFIFIPPGQLKARVRSRIILAPEHAKRMLKVMEENVGNYERRFGEIKLAENAFSGQMPPPRVVQ